jgi:hypothetical protein
MVVQWKLFSSVYAVSSCSSNSFSTYYKEARLF